MQKLVLVATNTSTKSTSYISVGNPGKAENLYNRVGCLITIEILFYETI